MVGGIDDNEQTLNGEEGSSTFSTDQQRAQMGGVFDTVDLPISTDGAEDHPEITESHKTAESDGDGEGDGDSTKDTSTDFHNHPRWQERELRMKELEAENRILKEVAEVVKGTRKSETEQPPQNTPTTPRYTNVLEMSDSDIADALRDNPKGFMANLYVQVMHELKTEMATEVNKTETTKKVKGTYDQFAEKNPDFNDMWKDGTIKKFMDTNPGHNPMSAYNELTAEKRMQTEIEKAVAKAKKEVEDSYRSKTKATTLAGRNSNVPSNGVDDVTKVSRTGLPAVLLRK